MLKKTLFLICSLGCLSALAQAKRSLYFQVDKNNVQVLPQRFEYALLNEDQLQLGDLVIDSTNLFFSIRENKSQNTATLEFTWPVNLLSKGELAIKQCGQSHHLSAYRA